LNPLKIAANSVFAHSSEEWKTEGDRLAGGSEEIRNQWKQISEEASSLPEKIEEGLTEIKEEPGAMLRFSFADLEKKISVLGT
jgi:hypothetical protein